MSGKRLNLYSIFVCATFDLTLEFSGKLEHFNKLVSYVQKWDILFSMFSHSQESDSIPSYYYFQSRNFWENGFLQIYE